MNKGSSAFAGWNEDDDDGLPLSGGMLGLRTHPIRDSQQILMVEWWPAVSVGGSLSQLSPDRVRSPLHLSATDLRRKGQKGRRLLSALYSTAKRDPTRETPVQERPHRTSMADRALQITFRATRGQRWNLALGVGAVLASVPSVNWRLPGLRVWAGFVTATVVVVTVLTGRLCDNVGREALIPCARRFLENEICPLC